MIVRLSILFLLTLLINLAGHTHTAKDGEFKSHSPKYFTTVDNSTFLKYASHWIQIIVGIYKFVALQRVQDAHKLEGFEFLPDEFFDGLPRDLCSTLEIFRL